MTLFSKSLPAGTKGPFLESPVKPFVILRLAHSGKLVFSHVVKGITKKITGKFRASRRLRFEDTKRIMSPEMRQKVSGLLRNRPQALRTRPNQAGNCVPHFNYLSKTTNYRTRIHWLLYLKQGITNISKIQLLVHYQCCILIGWATTRLYVIAHLWRKAPAILVMFWRQKKD